MHTYRGSASNGIQSYLAKFLPIRILSIIGISCLDDYQYLDGVVLASVDLALQSVEISTLVAAFVWDPPFEKPWAEK
jgi:branched-subunit amino acid transport protein AzlD